MDSDVTEIDKQQVHEFLLDLVAISTYIKMLSSLPPEPINQSALKRLQKAKDNAVCVIEGLGLPKTVRKTDLGMLRQKFNST